MFRVGAAASFPSTIADSLVYISVMRGLVPGLVPRIHIFLAPAKAWMAGTTGRGRDARNIPSPDISHYPGASGRRISESCCATTTFWRFEERPDADRV